MFSYADEMVTARQIKLRTKTQVQHRSIPVSPDAFIENSLLTIDLLSTVPTVTVTIKDAETGEVVYTSTNRCITLLLNELHYPNYKIVRTPYQ